MTTARPILFSTPMVRALLDGRKSMTRRTVKQQERLRMGTDVLIEGDHRPEYLNEYGSWQQWVPNARTMRCPHGKAGDLLWVRERAHYGPDRVAYSADNPALAHGEKVDGWGPARPSIHMPRWASRLTLEITDVRVERLQDISEEDAIAEGVDAVSMADVPRQATWSRRQDYVQLWEKLNGKGSWDLNPWVWVLTFAVHHANAQEFVDRAIYEARAAIAKAEDAP